MNTLPESLKKINHEIVVVNNKPMLVVVNLVEFNLQNWPKDVILNLHQELINDSKALESLDLMSIPDNQKLEKFSACRYGGFDQEADINKDGSLTPDYFDCPERGNCPGEGKVCLNVQCDNGTLTKRELEFCRLLTDDLLDKQIADKMGVSYNTVNSFKKSAQEKIGVHSKAGIAAFVMKKNLV